MPEKKADIKEKEDEDERTGEVVIDESPSGADICSPAPHTNEEATVTIALEHDTLPQGDDLLVTTHLYLSITLPPFFVYASLFTPVAVGTTPPSPFHYPASLHSTPLLISEVGKQYRIA